MSRRADEIRRQISKRRKNYMENRRRTVKPTVNPSPFSEDEIETSVYESDPKDSFHPLWNRDVFLMKILISAILVLVVAIIFKSPSTTFDKFRASVQKTMETEFQFATVANWYESHFGKPLALLPPFEKETENPDKMHDYSQPVSGKVLEDFSGDGRGIIIETGQDADVKAMSGGNVIFAGVKEDIGKTVIIQHADHSESWYGRLDSISVKTHQNVKEGEIVGNVAASDENQKGEFYFAIKQNDTFIDPIQVMKFE